MVYKRGFKGDLRWCTKVGLKEILDDIRRLIGSQGGKDQRIGLKEYLRR